MTPVTYRAITIFLAELAARCNNDPDFVRAMREVADEVRARADDLTVELASGPRLDLEKL